MILSLQSLRFIFVMFIVLFHLNGKNYEVCGDCGVSFFFILSGFVLSYAYGSRVLQADFKQMPFLVKQWAKIYPLHLLMLVVVALLDARLGYFYEWWQLLPNILMIQSWFPFDSIIYVANASSWFLGPLMLGYFVFPWLIRVFYKVSWVRLIVGGILFLILYEWAISYVPIQQVNNVVCLSPYLRLPDFCIGIILCRCWQSRKGMAYGHQLQSWSVSRATLCEVLAMACVVLAFLSYDYLPSSVRCASLFWIALSPLFLVFVGGDSAKGLLTRLLHQPALLWLGGITLEIYLTHSLVIRVFYSVLHSCGLLNGEPSTLHKGFTVPLMVACAYMFHRWFVQPVCRFLYKNRYYGN